MSLRHPAHSAVVARRSASSSSQFGELQGEERDSPLRAGRIGRWNTDWRRHCKHDTAQRHIVVRSSSAATPQDVLLLVLPVVPQCGAQQPAPGCAAAADVLASSTSLDGKPKYMVKAPPAAGWAPIAPALTAATVPDGCIPCIVTFDWPPLQLKPEAERAELLGGDEALPTVAQPPFQVHWCVRCKCSL